METQLLREQDIFPSEDVLKSTLGSIYPVYKSLMEIITNINYGLAYEWNYYRDGKSWLCKVVNKKKTVFWLSVCDGFLKISFFHGKTFGRHYRIKYCRKYQGGFLSAESRGEVASHDI